MRADPSPLQRVLMRVHKITQTRAYRHGHHASHMCYLAMFALENGTGMRMVLAIALIVFASCEWLTNGEPE